MKVKQKTKAQFDRKKTLARIEKRAELVKEYNDLMQSFEFTDPVKLKESTTEYFGTEEASVESGLKEWDAEQPKYPQGKYQDYGEVYVTYQQKFVEVLRDVTTQVFEDLRSLIPNFNILFGKYIEKYYEVIQELKSDSFYYSDISPNYQSPDFNYLWDALKVLFLSTQYQ